MYIKRSLENKITEYLTAFPVVCITGPRQSGKSTMLQHCLSDDYRYITMDDNRISSLFYDDPERFLSVYSDKVIIDEVQKAPELFDYLKRAVDNDRDNYGKYVITGSSQFPLMSKLSETLAGRIGLLTLLPFQFSEIPEYLHQDCIYKGCYPELVTRDYKLSLDWYSSYVETYINKDVLSMLNIGDMRDFKRLLKLLASNVSQQLNMSTLATNIGVSVPTVKRWISVLEASYIIHLLPPFYQNYGKRVTRAPKVYFCDTGLAAFLCGIDTFSAYDNGPLAGPLFENYIVMECMKREDHTGSHADFYYYRTNHGAEIDLIIEKRDKLEFIEIKKSMTFKKAMVNHLDKLGKPADKRTLIYNGEDFPYGDDIQIKNYKHYLM